MQTITPEMTRVKQEEMAGMQRLTENDGQPPRTRKIQPGEIRSGTTPWPHAGRGIQRMIRENCSKAWCINTHDLYCSANRAPIRSILSVQKPSTRHPSNCRARAGSLTV